MSRCCDLRDNLVVNVKEVLKNCSHVDIRLIPLPSEKMIMTEENKDILTKNFSCGKWNLTEYENNIQEQFGFWVVGVISFISGLGGICLNIITVVIILKSTLRKLFFNKLLCILTFFDIAYLILGIYESVRLHLTGTDYCQLHGHLLIVLRPLRYFFQCNIIYLTCSLTFERYMAVVRPIRHRSRFIGSTQMKRLFKYISPSLFFSFVYCFPRLFAFHFKKSFYDGLYYYDADYMDDYVDEPMIDDYRMTNHSFYANESDSSFVYSTMNQEEGLENYGNKSFQTNDYADLQSFAQNTSDSNYTISYCLSPTDLMKDHHYRLWYKNISNIILTGLLPFAFLAYLNYKIHKATKSALQTREELFMSTLDPNTPRLTHFSRKSSRSSIIVPTTKNSLHCNANGSSTNRNTLSHQNSCTTNRSEIDEHPRKHNQGTGPQKTEEHSQAHILFSIVVCFFLCHFVRLYLDVEELVNYEERKRVIDELEKLGEFCSGIPFGAMITNDLLHLLLQLNSSITFFIYLSFSTQFKEASKAMLLGIVEYFHLYQFEPGIDNDREATTGRHRYNSSINTHTTNSFRTPPVTFKRNRKNQQTEGTSQQHNQTDSNDEVIIQHNSIPNPPVASLEPTSRG